MRSIGLIILFSLLPAGSFFLPETRIPGKPDKWKKINFRIPPAFTPTPSKNTSPVDTTRLKKSGWYADALKNIQESEYEIKSTGKINEFASPNRKQNLRAFYTSDKFTLEPRTDDNWKLQLTLKGVYSGKKKIYSPQKKAFALTDKNKIQFKHNNEITVEYINSKEGVRQNFIIEKKPVDNPAAVSIKLQTNKGWFISKVHKKEIHFAKKGGENLETKIVYNDLKVWDAENHKLDSYFDVSDNEMSIVVNTDCAIYPVTVDPLSTSPSTILNGASSGDFFGVWTESAGDVNGDGYSDVIVGALGVSSSKGAAYLYMGSASGLSSSPADTLNGITTGDRFGERVSSAGDVNGDGYSDVIVSAPFASSSRGAVYVFLGSAGGLNSSPVITLSGTNPGDLFGYGLSCAGDVNNDGKSDVIIGASGVNSNRGAAFIYLGNAGGVNGVPTTSLVGSINGDNFGFCVDGAGDVNGDGYSDVIVGAYGVNTNRGAAYIYHGNPGGVNSSPITILIGANPGDLFGFWVACAGDVNGDGYSDVIVGAHSAASNTGAAYIYLGGSGGINSSPATILNGFNAGDHFGFSVKCSGDINGDGYSDVIVGALTVASSTGAMYLFLGSSIGISTTPSQTLNGFAPNTSFGQCVSFAGDINGDGYSDIIVGAPSTSTNTGAAYVYHGSPDGLSATFVNTPDDCNQAFAEFGCSVASAGDVNGDGFSDVIIGAYKYDDGGTIDEGRAFVYYGSATGLSAIPNSTPDDANQAGAYFGWSVASAGDINGDGYSDVIIGAYQYDDNYTDEGRAFIYRGSPSGLSATPDSNPPDDADQLLAWFGFSVAGAGDVNGDGFGDVIIGAHPFDDNTSWDEGRAFVYHGSATGLSVTPNSTPDDADQAFCLFGVCVASAGDVNGDGYSDVIIGADLYNNGFSGEGRAFIYHGSAIGLSATPNTVLDDANQVNAYFGRLVAGAGDVNGDGYSDVIVGAFAYADPPNGLEGRAYVYHGSATGVSTTPNSILDDANQANAFFGLGVASAGDVNGDGYSDVIIGAPYYDDPPNTDEGRVFLHYGSPTGLSATPDNIPDDANQANALFGFSVASAGDVNGDGYSDVIIGAYSYDELPSNNDEGRAFIYYGNNTGGLRNNLRLYNSDLVTPIQQSNMADPNLFGAGLFAKSFLGRQKGRMVWQTVKNGQPFTGSPITNSTLFTAQTAVDSIIDLTGKELKHQIAKQNPGKATYIRARLKYDKVTAITGQVYGPWRYPEGFLRGRRDIGAVALPVKFISFNAVKQNNAALLKWTTMNEEPGVRFEVQHSTDGINFTTLTSINGRNQTRNEYEWLHVNPQKGNNFYRIKAVENQKEFFTATKKLNFTDATVISIFPNPAVVNQQLNAESVSIMQNQPLKISFINSAGQIVWQKEIVATADGMVRFNVPAISAGAYLLLVQAGQWTSNEKIAIVSR